MDALQQPLTRDGNVFDWEVVIGWVMSQAPRYRVFVFMACESRHRGWHGSCLTQRFVWVLTQVGNLYPAGTIIVGDGYLSTDLYL